MHARFGKSHKSRAGSAINLQQSKPTYSTEADWDCSVWGSQCYFTLKNTPRARAYSPPPSVLQNSPYSGPGQHHGQGSRFSFPEALSYTVHRHESKRWATARAPLGLHFAERASKINKFPLLELFRIERDAVLPVLSSFFLFFILFPLRSPKRSPPERVSLFFITLLPSSLTADIFCLN